MDDALHELLAGNPQLWQGRGGDYRHRVQHLPTGCPELDAILPGGGWPASALSELVMPHWGVGELQLLTPLMCRLTAQGRWLMWVCPPHTPYAPALLRAGIDTRYLAVIPSTGSPAEYYWSLEKTLQSGACGLVLGWARRFRRDLLRRLQLAAEKGRCAGVLLSTVPSRNSPAALRLRLQSASDGLEVSVLKARGSFAQRSIVIRNSAG